MNNLLSYCGLVDARISASEKDLPVRVQYIKIPSSEHVENINCSECQNKNNFCTQHVLRECTKLIGFMY